VAIGRARRSLTADWKRRSMRSAASHRFRDTATVSTSARSGIEASLAIARRARAAPPVGPSSPTTLAKTEASTTITADCVRPPGPRRPYETRPGRLVGARCGRALPGHVTVLPGGLRPPIRILDQGIARIRRVGAGSRPRVRSGRSSRIASTLAIGHERSNTKPSATGAIWARPTACPTRADANTSSNKTHRGRHRGRHDFGTPGVHRRACSTSAQRVGRAGCASC